MGVGVSKANPGCDELTNLNIRPSNFSIIKVDYIMNGQQFSGKFYTLSFTAALVAAFAAYLCALFNLPVWVMWVGWVATHTRGHTIADSGISLFCLIVGVAIGMATGLAHQFLSSDLSSFALPLAVFLAASVVISLRSLPHINNIPAYFLGMVCFFALHHAPSIEVFATLAGTATVGALASVCARFLQNKLIGQAPVTS